MSKTVNYNHAYNRERVALPNLKCFSSLVLLFIFHLSSSGKNDLSFLLLLWVAMKSLLKFSKHEKRVFVDEDIYLNEINYVVKSGKRHGNNARTTDPLFEIVLVFSICYTHGFPSVTTHASSTFLFSVFRRLSSVDYMTWFPCP